MSKTFTSLGDLLLRRYVVDYISQMQSISYPIKISLPYNFNLRGWGGSSIYLTHECSEPEASTIIDLEDKVCINCDVEIPLQVKMHAALHQLK